MFTGKVYILKYLHHYLQSTKDMPLKCTKKWFNVQVDLVICCLFICEFAYLRLQIDHIFGTYPPIYSHSWSFYMRIHYMQDKFFGPYLSHITRSTCINGVWLNFFFGFDEFWFNWFFCSSNPTGASCCYQGIAQYDFWHDQFNQNPWKYMISNWKHLVVWQSKNRRTQDAKLAPWKNLKSSEIPYRNG